MKNRLFKACWQDLPEEMWEEIGKRIKSRVGILHFRSVCKKWRSSLPYPTRLPLSVPPLPNCHLPFITSRPFKITQVDYYHTDSELPKVVLEEVDRDRNFHPFWSSPNNISEPLQLPLTRHYFGSHAYHLRIFLSRIQESPISSAANWVKKVVIILSDEANGINPSYVGESELTVVAHLASGKKKGRLAMFRLQGETHEKWAWDTQFCRRVFQVIGTYRGRLCMLDSAGRVSIMSNNLLQISQLTPPSSIAREKVEVHLFEALGDLYLVKLIRFECFKYSFQLQEWVRVKFDFNVISSIIPLLI